MDPLFSAVRIGQVKILGKSRRRGKQGLSDWSDVARGKPSVDLEVSTGHIATIAGGNWGT